MNGNLPATTRDAVARNRLYLPQQVALWQVSTNHQEKQIVTSFLSLYQFLVTKTADAATSAIKIKRLAK